MVENSRNTCPGRVPFTQYPVWFQIRVPLTQTPWTPTGSRTRRLAQRPGYLGIQIRYFKIEKNRFFLKWTITLKSLEKSYYNLLK